MNNYDYENRNEFDNTQGFNFNQPKPKPKSNIGLIVAVSVLSSIMVIAAIVITLFATGVISFKTTTDDTAESIEASVALVDEFEPIPVQRVMFIKCDISVTLRTAPSADASEICQIPVGNTVYVIEYVNEEFARVTFNGTEGFVMKSYLSGENPIVNVQKTMYINCNSSLTLRTGPATSYSEIMQISVGEPVYVIEYINSDFARVTYNGNEGYVMRKYLSDTKPQVWYYNEYDVAQFVENSLYAFVNGINTENTDYVYKYFTGDEAEQEIKSCKTISDSVISEEILQVNCHSVERVSPSRVSVIRDSVIRVVYNDNSVKDITEKYKYTVDLSQGRMYIVDIEKA